MSTHITTLINLFKVNKELMSQNGASISHPSKTIIPQEAEQLLPVTTAQHTPCGYINHTLLRLYYLNYIKSKCLKNGASIPPHYISARQYTAELGKEVE